MSKIPPVDSGGMPYKPQFKVSPEFRKMWTSLFKGVELSDLQIHQMTDQFVKSVSDQMNSVLNWAIQQQKERDEKEKKGD